MALRPLGKPVGVLKITTTYYGEGTDPIVIKITSPNI